MVQDDHHMVDGTRELVVGQPTKAAIRPIVAGVEETCYTVAHCEAFAVEIPAHCQVVIPPGRWAIEHNLQFTSTSPLKRYVFCARCAIRDYAHWGIAEVSP